MTDDHVDEAFDRLLATYGEPKTDNLDGFTVEFRTAIEGYQPRILQLAVTAWIRKDTPFWPRPGELAAECRRVLADPRHRPAPPVEKVNADPRPKRTEDEYASVDRLAKAAIERLPTLAPVGNMRKQDIDWKRGQRHEFEAMREASLNRFHRRKA